MAMEPMPMSADPGAISDEEVDQAVSEDSRRAEQSMESQLSEMIPVADEPLDPSRLNALAETVKATMAAWGSDEVFSQEVKSPSDSVPIDIAKYVIALASTASDPNLAESAPNLAKLAFDPIEAMTSNKGLIDATVLIRKMGDSVVVDELQGASDGVQTGSDGSESGAGDTPEPAPGRAAGPAGADTPEPAPARKAGPGAAQGRAPGRGGPGRR